MAIYTHGSCHPGSKSKLPKLSSLSMSNVHLAAEKLIQENTFVAQALFMELQAQLGQFQYQPPKGAS